MPRIDDQATLGVVSDLFATIADLAKGGDALEEKLKELRELATTSTALAEEVREQAKVNARDAKANDARAQALQSERVVMDDADTDLREREARLAQIEEDLEARTDEAQRDLDARKAAVEAELTQQQSLLNARAESMNEQKRGLDATKAEIQATLQQLDARAKDLDRQAAQLGERLDAFQAIAKAANA